MVTKFTKDKDVLIAKKEHLLLEISHTENSYTKLDDTLAILNHQIATGQSALRERSKLDEQAKNIRSSRNHLAAKKKALELGLPTAEKKLQDLDGICKEFEAAQEILAAQNLENNKLDETYPSSSLDAIKKEIEEVHLALMQLQRHPDSSENKVEADHKKSCDEKRQEMKNCIEKMEKERSANLELIDNQDMPDPTVAKAKEDLEKLTIQMNTNDDRFATLEKKSFDNRGHQLLVRKYKMLRAASKLYDQVASLAAKIAKIKKP